MTARQKPSERIEDIRMEIIAERPLMSNARNLDMISMVQYLDETHEMTSNTLHEIVRMLRDGMIFDEKNASFLHQMIDGSLSEEKPPSDRQGEIWTNCTALPETSE